MAQGAPELGNTVRQIGVIVPGDGQAGLHPAPSTRCVSKHSLEEDEELSELYEDLLANAALGRKPNDLASFASILRQLSPSDAQLLQRIFNRYVMRARETDENKHASRPFPSFDLRRMRERPGVSLEVFASDLRRVEHRWTPEDLMISVDNLLRLGVLRDVSSVEVLVDNAFDFRSAKFPTAPRPITARVKRAGVMEKALPTDNTAYRETSVLQPKRDYVSLSDLGLAFARSVNPPSLVIPEVQWARP